jgi:murein DD-endopeptidase MepM/ murein hydrolase activator NlpD
VFKGNEPTSDTTSSTSGTSGTTRAESLFGASSSAPAQAKEAEPAKETPPVPAEASTSLFRDSTPARATDSGAAETKSTSSSYRSTAVFGKSSSTSSDGSSGSGSRATAVFGSKRSSHPQAQETASKTEEKEGQNKGNEAIEHENPRSAPNFMWPIDGGKIGSFYGWRSSRRFHDGIDIAAPAGTKVFASKSGEVIYSGNRIRGYGNMIVIRHNGGFSTVYAHNKVNLVNKGDIVKQGDIIAHVGSTGHSTGPHSHFEVRKGKYSADPLKYLSSYDVKKHSGSYANSKDNPF